MLKNKWPNIESGPDSFPEEIYVIIEVSKDSKEKYELDKERGVLFLDRDLFGPISYPADYGMVAQTLCDDGDAVDALVLVSRPHQPGVVIPARPVALMGMSDEKGKDDKVLCVPSGKIDPTFQDIKDLEDVPQYILDEIRFFFEHYKDLEEGKWVKIDEWKNAEEAKKFLIQSAEEYKK